MRRVLLIFFLGGIFFNNINSQNSEYFPYQLNISREIFTTTTGLGLIAGGSYSYQNMSRLIESRLLEIEPQQIWALDRAATRQFSQPAVEASDLLRDVSMVLPLALIASKKARKNWMTVGVMWIEANLVSEGLTKMVKGTTKRLRPYTYNPEVPLGLKRDRSSRLSFFSGHTSKAAVNSFFAAKVFNDLYPDSSWKPVVWAVAALIPAATGTARYLGGRHYPTDIMAGYAAGALIGILMPELHKIRIGKNQMRVRPVLDFSGQGQVEIALWF